MNILAIDVGGTWINEVGIRGEQNSGGSAT